MGEPTKCPACDRADCLYLDRARWFAVPRLHAEAVADCDAHKVDWRARYLALADATEEATRRAERAEAACAAQWRKQPPTEPGAYWYRMVKGRVVLMAVDLDGTARPIVPGFTVTTTPETLDASTLKGEWAPCLPPGDASAAPRALPAVEPAAPSSNRDNRQKVVAEWLAAAFGSDHASSLPQRAVRLLEEAIEAYQSANGAEAMAQRLVAYVFARAPGRLAQEIGGVGVTLLALANAAGLSAEAEEAREVARVLSKPLEHFRARNEQKNAAGFEVAAAPAERKGG